jgi:hypothetical protein
MFCRQPLRPLSAEAPNAARAPIQAKLRVGAANDPLEHEADRAADAVMRGEQPRLSDRSSGQVQRKCSACEAEEDEAPLQRKAGAEGAVTSSSSHAPPAVNDVLDRPGAPLDPASRAYFEPRFGRGLADVRVHADGQAAASARAVNARAYTVANHIVLGPGTADRRLLAHELAHVVQQDLQGRPVLRRQVFGDFKGDPCVSVPDIPAIPEVLRGAQLCGQSAADACKKFPIPGCGLVCKAFDCSTPAQPGTRCWPGWRAATSEGFAGQCCKGGIDNAQNCCPPDQISLKEDRCCPPGEIVVDNKCAKPSALPGPICLPWQRTLTGECCVPPMVPQGLRCAAPGGPSNPPPLGPLPAGPQLGALWTDEIHFRQNHPAAGESTPDRVLTQAGIEELKSALSWLKLSPDLEVRLIGHASSEGAPDYNQELATRRARFVAAVLAKKGFSARISDPLLSDGAESGCQRLDAGQWSCGEERSDPAAARPEERVVRVTFARNRLPPLPPLTPPPLRPR